MWRRRPVLANGLLALGSTTACLLVLELVVFRWILPGSDRPELAFVDGVIRYRAGQTGVSRHRREYAAAYRINASGWNSGHERYETLRTPGRSRVAVLGDSYVAALNLHYAASLAERLERELDGQAEVYRFAIPGAPLSHHLHVLRREVLKYDPDLVVVVLVHNDLHESYAFKPGVYVSSFLKLDVVDGRVEREIPPLRYERPWYGWIRDRSAIWGYLALRQGVRLTVLRDLILGRDPKPYEANVEPASVQEGLADIEAATRYVLGSMKELTDRHGCDLLLVMDGNRRAIYDGTDGTTEPGGALSLNRLLGRLAEEAGIPLLDLHPVFARHYRADGRRFEYASDHHWNGHGHALVARALADRIRQGGRIASGPEESRDGAALP